MRVFGKKTTQHSITLMLVLLGTGYSLNAEVYRWKDGKGITHYSDRPPSAITSKKSDELLLKIIKNDSYCANPSTPKAEIAPIDFSNSHFFNVINTRLNQQQASGLSAIASGNLAGRVAPRASSGAPVARPAAAVARSAPVANATPIASSRPATSNGFRPLGFGSVTRATPFGVSIASLSSVNSRQVDTPVATPAPNATTQASTQSTSTQSTTDRNQTVAVANTTTPVAQSQGSSLMPVVDLSKTPTGDVGFNSLRIRPATHDGTHTDKLGAFRTDCAITHYSNDDPIIYPGARGAAHHHTFFGNAAVDFSTTSESILNTGNSSCAGGTANRSGYWIPSIIDTATGAPLKPFRGVIYYKAGLVPGRFVQPFPKGLRMIAGDMSVKTTTQVTRQPPHDSGFEPAKFACVNESANSYTGEGKLIPACRKAPAGRSVDGYIRLSINFPQCWDGKNLDSPDHKSHMAHAHWEQIDANGRKYWPESRCPTTHPIALPQVTEIFDFEVTDAVHGTNNWRLSSDNYPASTRGGLSLHADWMNGWDESIMKRIVKNCLNKDIDCGVNYLGDGEALF